MSLVDGQSKFARYQKLPSLKSEANSANGGIGVSFSTMVLGTDVGYPTIPKSSYQQHYNEDRTRTSKAVYLNYSPNSYIESNFNNKQRLPSGVSPSTDGAMKKYL